METLLYVIPDEASGQQFDVLNEAIGIFPFMKAKNYGYLGSFLNEENEEELFHEEQKGRKNIKLLLKVDDYFSGRMSFTDHLRAWQLVSDMIYAINSLYKSESESKVYKIMRTMISEFMIMTPKGEKNNVLGYGNIFMYAPEKNIVYTNKAIRHLLDNCRSDPPKFMQLLFVLVPLEFCRSLHRLLM
ncbi:hypothetical protein MLD38_005053 [Melastoma candidum]|uniref:Uncharacterized protein n=1 Tax=Melastoma candidum TaxID=119954 RepID=A0ACB9S831_9MYRT|nr:hypothetical protein MLD38_005053 [Melastoma candidum]